MKPTWISVILFVFGLLATIISSAMLFSVDGDRRDLEFQKSSTSVQSGYSGNAEYPL
ncbi:MAG: hypothetical protein HQ477_00260 [Chloroflexi bacterium]|nr:hypothetical protein [Chloroflexota bacterium]